MHDHGHNRVYYAARDLVRRPSAAELEGRYQRQVDRWRSYLEQDEEMILDPEQLAALEAILDFGEEWGMEITIVLYPRMPVTMTDEGREGTLMPFVREITERADRRGIPVIDFVESSPLRDEHFESDFDHVTRKGNELFAEWALEGDLAFLLQSPRAASAGPGS